MAVTQLVSLPNYPKVGRRGIPEAPLVPNFTAKTWCSWIELRSKPTRDAAM